ncbi:Zinc finger protein 532 [Camelus dromedarius]|uniref:Zinc finger protein 532 n=1 Tax=Camelus dromedarius TaxID=9838 RepID=A0A5N4DJW7_CAMDR|nr:Zinc finger protein 532 [Camelus dromedarius]
MVTAFILFPLPVSEWGSSTAGGQGSVTGTAVSCVLQVPRHLPQGQRSGIRGLVGSGDCFRINMIRVERQERSGEIRWVSNEKIDGTEEKQEENDEELDLNKALQSAGKHMEDCIIASYTALLLECLCQESPLLVFNAVAPVKLTPRQVMIKTVVTTFLPAPAMKTAGLQLINLKLVNNTTVKAMVISAASIQSTSSAIIKATDAIQQQTAVCGFLTSAAMPPTRESISMANAKLMPKTVHLTNLNLQPKGAQATSELCQVLTQPQQQIINITAS